MNSARWCLQAVTIVISVALAGCASPVPRSQPTLSVTIHASPTLNPDDEGRPTPVIVRIYELRARDALDRATFFELYDHDARVLEGALLRCAEITVSPGETVPLVRPLDPATRAVAIVAAYERIDDAKWRASVTLASAGAVELTATLGSSAVTLADTTPARPVPKRGLVTRWMDPVWKAATSMFGGANERPPPNAIGNGDHHDVE